MITYFINNQIWTNDNKIKFSKNLINKKHNIFIKQRDEKYAWIKDKLHGLILIFTNILDTK